MRDINVINRDNTNFLNNFTVKYHTPCNINVEKEQICRTIEIGTIRGSVLNKCMTTLLRHAKHDESKEGFIAIFPEVVDTLTKSKTFGNVPTFLNHYAQVLEYNVLKEKRFRPSIILDTYKTVELPENLNEKNLYLAGMLAWCVELLHTSILINDDLMDSSKTRASEISWYRKENVGLNAVNDAVLVMEGAFVLLKEFFLNHRAYLQLSDLFCNINMAAAVGKSLDWKCNANGKSIFELFNRNTYNVTIRYKGSIPFVEGPFQAALILSNNANEHTLRETSEVVMKLGEAYQIDNDVLDIFDNGSVRRQIGNDISEGKCTWLAIQVLQHGNKEMRQTLKDNYGRVGREFEEKVVNVYTKMDLFGKYLAYRNETQGFVNERAKAMTPLLKNASLKLVKNIFPIVTIDSSIT